MVVGVVFMVHTFKVYQAAKNRFLDTFTHGTFVVNYSSMLSGPHVFINYMISYFSYGFTVQILYRMTSFINVFFLYFMKIVSITLLYLSI